MPYISDPLLITRVQNYLELHTHQTYVDINDIVDELQHQFKEYERRKRSAFAAAVKKAYSIVLAKYGLDSDNTPVNSDDDSSIDLLDSSSKNDSMNSQLANMYKNKATPMKEMDESELIDISSDDESEQPVPMHSSKEGRVPNTAPEKNGIHQSYDGDRFKKRKHDYATIVHVTPQPNKKRKYSSSSNSQPRDGEVNFSHVGGMEKTLEEVAKSLLHINHPEIYKTIGITPPRGFLLHGPPGCGKSLLAHAIAGELNIQFFKVTAPELVAGVSGESEQRIRNLFQRAFLNSPCILFIDEIDTVTQKRENAQKDMEKRMVAQLLSCLDELNKSEQGSRVLVIGATNRPETIDPALRRSGRFDREICLGIPNKESRAAIIKIVTRKLKLEPNFDYELLASLTPGYVGADLLALTREASMVAVDRMIKELREKEKKLEEEEEEEEEAESLTVKPTKPTKIDEDKAASVDPGASTAGKEKGVQENENDTSESPEVDSTEIVVDDIPDKQSSAAVAVNDITTSDNTAESIILIDDESQSIKPPKKSKEAQNISSLDEILFWLHDQLPLSEEELESLRVTMGDFRDALKSVQPSSKREGFITVPDTTWEDIGSLNNIREELQLSIVAPVRYSKQFQSLGINVPAGVLLFGPPGCGKTLLAKAIANEASINFISIKGPELLNMYVGESERAVRVCFERARNSAPCVIFFDELDALCPKRSHSDNSGISRVVNQLLTEMDGVSGRQGVYLLAATNRVDIIDKAILRPGRLDKLLYVGLPNANDRADILKAITKNATKPALSPDVSLLDIAERKECDGFTGADLAALVREASICALKDVLSLPGEQVPQEVSLTVTLEHFNRAFRKVRGSVSEKDQQYYENMRRTFSSDRKDSEVEEMELS